MKGRKLTLRAHKKRTEKAERALYDYTTKQINRTDIDGDMNYVREEYIRRNAEERRRARF